MEFKITKDQIEELAAESSHFVEKRLKEWFPEAFKTELEVGKWYKSEDRKCHIFFVTKIEYEIYSYYGFNSVGRFTHDWYSVNDFGLRRGFVPATDEEVEEALIAEAKRRGYTTKNTKSIDGIGRYEKVDKNFNFSYCAGLLHSQPSGEGGKLLFDNGQWAEIISEPIELTLEDIAEKFGVSVEEIKIKK